MAGRKNFLRRNCQKHDIMNSVNNAKNINESENEIGHQYNFQHIVIVTKYRFKMFKNPKTTEAVRKSFYDVADRHKIKIKELSFGDDFAHVHIEISIPNTMSVSHAVQLLKGYSSYSIFRDMPNHRLRYKKGHFWSAGYSNGSVGPRDEETLQNYIRKQDVSTGQIRLAM